MNIFRVILYNFISGSFCLVYGVNTLGKGLEQLNQKSLKRILFFSCGNVYKAFLSSTVITAIIQSSTAVTVTMVGLVNSGLMNLTQAAGVIYGSNIGTTVTAQLMTINIRGFSWIIILFGFMLKAMGKTKALRATGKAFLGMGLMFTGIGILHSGVPFLQESRMVYNLFQSYGNNVLIAVLLGMVSTMVVHSSSATVAISILLYDGDLIDIYGACGLMLGSNIGTCISAQLVALRSSVSAKRSAWIHTFYNVICVILTLIFINPFINSVSFLTFLMRQEQGRLVANAHTLFNVLSALLFLPLTRYYIKFIEWVIPEN